mmetsp:Transcript_61936/g.115809  ORF Transcript_61936/g.115809 Transcript_61936/m.115809 type:complete len:87 (+) Transcript_61936:179-439(+)
MKHLPMSSIESGDNRTPNPQTLGLLKYGLIHGLVGQLQGLFKQFHHVRRPLLQDVKNHVAKALFTDVNFLDPALDAVHPTLILLED